MNRCSRSRIGCDTFFQKSTEKHKKVQRDTILHEYYEKNKKKLLSNPKLAAMIYTRKDAKNPAYASAV